MHTHTQKTVASVSCPVTWLSWVSRGSWWASGSRHSCQALLTCREHEKWECLSLGKAHLSQRVFLSDMLADRQEEGW